jgi:hypothetical protein
MVLECVKRRVLKGSSMTPHLSLNVISFRFPILGFVLFVLLISTLQSISASVIKYKSLRRDATRLASDARIVL